MVDRGNPNGIRALGYHGSTNRDTVSAMLKADSAFRRRNVRWAMHDQGGRG